MVTRHTRLGSAGAVGLMLGALAATGCNAGAPTIARTADAGTAAATHSLAGTVTVDGSSTVLPVSKAMAEAFQERHPGVRVTVQASGTGGGFKKFCAGAVDLAGASRPINAAESQDCQTGHVGYLELPVAFDSLSVVVNAANTFATCLTVDELKRMWEPAAEGKLTLWSQIRPGFPARPLKLFGPGASSGTFDYFTLAVVGTESLSRQDYTRSEDDEVLASKVLSDPDALAYFGYAYYLEHKDTLRLVSIDNGNGCVAPSAETVLDNSYQPLSRPIFLYLNAGAAARVDASAFAHFYLDPENARRVQTVGYVPLPTATLLAVTRRLDDGVTGSIFGGRGSVLGLTADAFQDRDRIQSALVR